MYCYNVSIFYRYIVSLYFDSLLITALVNVWNSSMEQKKKKNAGGGGLFTHLSVQLVECRGEEDLGRNEPLISKGNCLSAWEYRCI